MRNGKRFVLICSIKAMIRKSSLGEFIRKALRGSLLLGDKAYGSKKFIELVLSARLKSYVKVRESFRREIRSEG